MTTIHELTDELLLDRRAVEWLRLADGYIQMYNKAPALFVLPRAHAKVKPLIEVYANDLKGFVRYILGVRDSFLKDTPAYADLHKLYRTINTRLVQQERRERLGRAIERAIEIRGTTTSYDTRMRYARMLEQSWGKRRLDWMASYRSKTARNRLSIDERSEVLDGFWDEIEDEIKRGDLPPMEGE